MNSELQEQLYRCIETLVVTNNDMVKRSSETSQTKGMEFAVQMGINHYLIPTIESVCSQLFQQLNKTFSLGLSQFMDSMLQNVESQQPSDQSVIDQFLESNQVARAFEFVIFFFENNYGF